MGGIKKDNMLDLIKIGVKNIACITEITEADNIREKVRDLLIFIKKSINKAKL